ncbi:unnamed protein product [Tuber melanosporum]|uniref:(Perigord truffle) hypothetical protein n=1 Tax=Tuber melanosporum (strain Mel28) TaxID=656061 RepID=D5GP38_TUBMM|nr:uncharacterized protein GSTUM_00011661001 [Tuber melanosporum]CAZ86281.1 unnamed protein product [Tuber melanosporum]
MDLFFFFSGKRLCGPPFFAYGTRQKIVHTLESGVI